MSDISISFPGFLLLSRSIVEISPLISLVATSELGRIQDT